MMPAIFNLHCLPPNNTTSHFTSKQHNISHSCDKHNLVMVGRHRKS
jgi:hypothetical protein